MTSKISSYTGKEKAVHLQLSNLRKSLSNQNTPGNSRQVQQKISDCERELSNILWERQRCEKKREQLFSELERLTKALEQEDRFYMDEQRRKTAAKKSNEALIKSLTASAGAIAGLIHNQSSVSPPLKKGSHKKGIFWRWICLFLALGTGFNAFSHKDSKLRNDEQTQPSPMPTQSHKDGLAQWIGVDAGGVFSQYGEDFLLDYLAGGAFFYYEDSAGCPYNFYYYETSPELTETDIIWGISTGVEETCVAEGIYIGNTLQEVETILGCPLNPMAEEGSDFYPYLETTTEINGTKFRLLFGVESKNLVYAMGGQYE